MKKTIHALTIIDKSGSMQSFRGRTIEGINSNIAALRSEVDENTTILNTQLQFSSGDTWYNHGVPEQSEKDFVFKRIGESVTNIADMTESDYIPNGGTPLLDAIGLGIEKLKEFHKDDLGSDDLSIIVTVFTDGEENSSHKYTRDQIKQMIEHFQSDGKWTFSFVGCGSFDRVAATSAAYGISSGNTVAYAATDVGATTAYACVTDSYKCFARSAKLGVKLDKVFDNPNP